MSVDPSSPSPSPSSPRVDLDAVAAGLGLPVAVVELLTRVRTIAVVGASDDPSKAAHRIPRRLVDLGFVVVPVNPRGGRVLGLDTFASLDALAAAGVGPIDLVDVFRPARECPAVAAAAARIGAKALWLQQGIRSVEAAATATAAGMDYVEDRCLGVDAAAVARAGVLVVGGAPEGSAGPGADRR